MPRADTAHKLGSELLKLAERNKAKPKTKTITPTNGTAKQAPVKPKAPQNDTALCPRCQTMSTRGVSGVHIAEHLPPAVRLIRGHLPILRNRQKSH
jgi:hypothetical protein